MDEEHPDLNEPLTTTVRPVTMAIVTIRIIKSFTYRTVKNHVFKDLDLTTTTVRELVDKVKQVISSQSAFRAYRNVDLDTVKIYTKAHGSKTMNLVINLDHDDWVLSEHHKTLIEYGIENETELSIYNSEAYEEYKKNPQEKW
jgi:ACT domain-containing protein